MAFVRKEECWICERVEERDQPACGGNRKVSEVRGGVGQSNDQRRIERVEGSRRCCHDIVYGLIGQFSTSDGIGSLKRLA